MKPSRLEDRPGERSGLFNRLQKLEGGHITVLLNVVDNQHGRGKYNSLTGHSHLTVTPALCRPLRPRATRIDDLHRVVQKRFDNICWLNANFAGVSAAIKFHGIGGEQFHLLDQMAVNGSFAERMNAVQPTHVNDPWVGAMAICVGSKVWEICHCDEFTGWTTPSFFTA